MFAQLDKEFLDELMSTYDVSNDEVIAQMKELDCSLDVAFDVNTWIQIVLEKGYNNFVNHCDDVIADLDIDFDMSDFDPSIYTNCIDSGFDSKLTEFDITDFSEDNILNFLEAIGEYSKEEEEA